MEAIRLRREVRNEILAHARDQAPRECCGLLIGAGGEVDESVRSANLDPDPNRYRIDPAVHIATIRRLRGSGRSVLGAYHSHPHSPAVPSRSDYREAHYPEFVWLIVSLAAPEPEAVAAFRLADDRFMTLRIEESTMAGETATSVVASIRGEYLRYKALAEAAIAQIAEDRLSAAASNDSNSIATICWHVSGNLSSRFTDFLTADGEKPWRNREEEFDQRQVGRAELLRKWEAGWAVLLAALDGVTDDALWQQVTIRGQSLSVIEALHRSLAHTSYHVGQIVFIAKEAAGTGWTSLSIARGQSAAFNEAPRGQKPTEHVASLERGRTGA